MAENGIRKPKQERSIEKRNKILQVAKDLFSDKTYFNVTTNEIAKKAGVSVGTLYSYFASKEDILMTLLQRYNDFLLTTIFADINSQDSLELFKRNPKEWLKALVTQLLAAEDRVFHAQIEMLAYAIPQAKDLLEEHHHKIKDLTYKCFLYYSNQEDNPNFRILSLVVFDFISALVDELLYHEHTSEEFQKIKETGIDSLDLIIKSYLQ
ncbi:TetR/AcrR family transcriptional regulator [Streptococcus ratti]|uniref:TetR/AcrR family transcriptional regulator n=1 Tax=Streptococcus ratti TaxID=1341 RepID=A0A7X9LFI1_STRRT|nr:TetR/AcrR family transcriptional regulator [Streptococcus ratti]NMD49919.1 TetR/AcrR family transcriptional regulator [Streptococcus ratti]